MIRVVAWAVLVSVVVMVVGMAVVMVVVAGIFTGVGIATIRHIPSRKAATQISERVSDPLFRWCFTR